MDKDLYATYREKLSFIEEEGQEPATVQAALVTLHNLQQLAMWIADNGGASMGMQIRDWGSIADRGLLIGTVEGYWRLRLGSYLIHDISNMFWPMAGAAFNRRFELVAPADVE